MGLTDDVDQSSAEAVEIVVAILLASRIAFIFGTDEGILLALEDVDAAAVMV